jgi:cyclase
MFSRPRLIPCLLVKNQGIVKTTKFTNPRYIGDPVNTVKIFNNKGVDELCILDITASLENRDPDINFLKDIASEAFMPLSYGGGICTLEQIGKIFSIGYEKVILNTSFIQKPDLVQDAIKYYGSQSIVVSIDVKTDILGKRNCYIKDGQKKISMDPVQLVKMAEKIGAGEILINSINRDGTMQGYDIKLVKEVTDAVSIPVIACGGAGNINDIKTVLQEGGAHAASAGSLFIYYGKNKAVLITTPNEDELIKIGVYQN